MPELELTPIRLISSIEDLPWGRADPRTVYAVSGDALNEISAELQRLYGIRHAFANLNPPAPPPN